MADSFNHFSNIADALPQVLSQVVRKTAFDCQAHIQGFIRSNGQIDTGFMLNSVYTVTDEGSTYGAKVGPKASKRTGIRKPSARRIKAALAAQKQVEEQLLPEVERPDSPTTAYVAVGAAYAIHQNYGTRFMPGKPFFEPGIEATRPGFERACAAIEAKLAEAAR